MRWSERESERWRDILFISSLLWPVISKSNSSECKISNRAWNNVPRKLLRSLKKNVSATRNKPIISNIENLTEHIKCWFIEYETSSQHRRPNKMSLRENINALVYMSTRYPAAKLQHLMKIDKKKEESHVCSLWNCTSEFFVSLLVCSFLLFVWLMLFHSLSFGVFFYSSLFVFLLRRCCFHTILYVCCF